MVKKSSLIKKEEKNKIPEKIKEFPYKGYTKEDLKKYSSEEIVLTTKKLNWILIRRKIISFNLWLDKIMKYPIIKFSIPKFNLWEHYCIFWNKKINKESHVDKNYELQE